MRAVRSLFAVVATLAAAFAAAPAGAGALADVEIYDRTAGRTLPIYEHEGRLYVAGEPRHQYELRVRNSSGARVLAVTSVDGVNVITGQTAAQEQSGYVLGAHDSVRIEGWRKNLDELATFYFTKLADSYAARTGRPRDVVSGAGRAIGHGLPGGTVDLLRRDQGDRGQVHGTRGVDREAERHGRRGIGKFGNPVDVGFAERVVKGFQLPTEAFDSFLYRRSPG